MVAKHCKAEVKERYYYYYYYYTQPIYAVVGNGKLHNQYMPLLVMASNAIQPIYAVVGNGKQSWREFAPHFSWILG